MKKEMKCLCLMVVSGFLFVYLFSFVSAPGDNHPCENSNEVMIKLFQKNNSHGALANDPNYNFSICYNEVFPGFNAGASSTDCTGYNALLWLSNETNAHASDTNNSFTENVPVCFEDLSCDLEVGTNSSCVNGGNVVLRMSNESNAHLAEASYTNYIYKLCCTSVTDARWENTMGALISQSDKGDTVMLVVEGLNSKNGESVTFDVYEHDPTFLNPDEEIGSFDSIDVVQGGRAVAYWTITSDDIEKAQDDDYENFRFDVKDSNGVTLDTSEDLNISEEYDDNLLNLTIVSPFCSDGFTKSTPKVIEIVAYDDDDIISGTLDVFNGVVNEFNGTFTNGESIIYHYNFPNSGNVQIAASAVSRGFTLGRVSNVMVFDPSRDDVYVAACIDKPTGFEEETESNRVKFEAPSTKGYLYCSGDATQEEITKDDLMFKWIFSDDLAKEYRGSGASSNFWNFTHVYQRAGNNTASLGVDIESGAVTTHLNSC